MKKIFSVLLCAVLFLCGCAKTQSSVNANPNENILIDCAGRSVVLPDSTDKIACLYAYTGHAAVLLDCQDNICAVVNGLKRDHLMQRKIKNIEDMPCPYASGAINIEELAAANPDLIFLRLSNLQDKGETEKLDNLGIPYIVVDYVTVQDQIKSIQVMAKALGKEEKAAEYINYFNQTVQFVENRVQQLSANERKTVYHSVNEVVRTDIPNTLSFQVLETAGCINVVQSEETMRLDGDKGFVTVEQIYNLDPDIIVANEPSATEYFLTDNKFSGLRAVREQNVFQLPVGISRWAHPGSIETPIAILYTAKLVYPNLFDDVDINAEILNFYDKFFGIQLSDEDLQMIISGKGMRSQKQQGVVK